MTKRPSSRKPNRSKTTPSCCRECGRPIVPNRPLNLTPTQGRILDLIERHGEIHPEVLWNALYGSDPNGGPESPKILDVVINQMNAKLRDHGLAVKRRAPRKWEQPWHLVSLQEAAE